MHAERYMHQQRLSKVCCGVNMPSGNSILYFRYGSDLLWKSLRLYKNIKIPTPVYKKVDSTGYGSVHKVVYTHSMMPSYAVHCTYAVLSTVRVPGCRPAVLQCTWVSCNTSCVHCTVDTAVHGRTRTSSYPGTY